MRDRFTNVPKPAAPPRLAVRVAITGHRSLEPAAMAAIERSMARVLEAIEVGARAVAGAAQSGYDGSPPLLRAVSPLAEGADRTFARAALQRGWDLQCPLPFARAEYERDFESEESRNEFHGLLAQASSVFECDGTRDRAEAYRSVSAVVLNQAEVLLAVWNGGPSGGPGGTAEVVADAEGQHIPVVWIDARDGSIRVRDVDSGAVSPATWEDSIRAALERTLCIGGTIDPSKRSADDATDRSLFEDSIRIPRDHSSFLGAAFGLFSRALTWPTVSKAEPSEAGRAQDRSTRQPSPFAEHYRRANDAAVFYAGVDRGGVLANYLLGVAAVLCALLTVPLGQVDPPAPPWVLTALITGELLALLAMASLYMAARIGNPKRRALSCRLYAEQFRQMEFLWPLGRSTPESRPMAHDSFGDPRATAMAWRFRAVVREVGLASSTLGQETLEGILERIRDEWIGGPQGQLAYHRGVSRRIARQDHRLHTFAWIMFVATFACCSGHFLVHGNEAVELWLTAGSAALPALGAAAHAVTSQFEFRRLRERSTCMERNLEGTLEQLRAIGSSGRPISSRAVAETIYPASRAMMDEVMEWRILSSKPPSAPA